MKILEIDLKDGNSTISVVVCDGIAEERLLRFVNVSYDAFNRLVEISDFAHAHITGENGALKF